MVWECRQASIREPVPADQDLTLFLMRTQSHDAFTWAEMVEIYSRPPLTRPSDRLPAISGYAKEFAKATGDEYMAGHWRNDILQSLVWRIFGVCDPGQRPDSYIAPSWSWASVGHIRTMFQWSNRPKPVASLSDSCISLAGANPYGEVTDGWIELFAPMFHLNASKYAPNPYFWVPCNDYTCDQLVDVVSGVNHTQVQTAMRAREELDNDSAGEFFWDWKELTSKLRDLRGIVLMKSMETQNLQGLIVHPDPARANTFRRVGIFRDLVDLLAGSDWEVDNIRLI